MNKVFFGEPPSNIKQWIIDHSKPDVPTTLNGKVLYKTSTDGQWLESDANISNGTFNGFNEKSTAVEVIIPGKDANGNDVTSIGQDAFSDCNQLTSITIPNGVLDIGDNAFGNCFSLSGLSISGSIESIGLYAFAFCNSLTSIAIDKTVSEVEQMNYQDWYLGLGTDLQTGDLITFEAVIHCIDGDIIVNEGM